ncbi:hypothetical protein LDENG_00109220 [Lucifuga dentata]|nr:hypothetical protein LDENG_00109220 [Lucifuga dentata]
MEKTEAMDLSGQISEQIRNKSGFKWHKSIVYLGITIPHSLEQLYDLNYNKIIKSISEDLERWSALPLTMMGHIESVHMNVLLRLLYIFQMLPIEVPKSTFDRLNKLISKFIWQRKRPRIQFKTIQLPKPQGGLGLPNLRYYFWAAQLRPLISWLEDYTYTRWINIEKNLCLKPLKVIPFLDLSLKKTHSGLL